MHKHSVIIIITILLTILSCKTGIESSADNYNTKTVEFCELEQHNNQLINTELIYSGVDEYWSAKGYENCKEEFNNVYLDFNDYFRQNGHKSVNRKLKKIHAEYYLYKAKLTVTGIFQISPIEEEYIINKDTIMTTVTGFGHLNSYKSRIIIKEVVNIEILDK